ncbi:BnaC09g30750D [Brassica napus]|uniref:BnaC09g30750D protein n=1 Tax=Brassica napus TaxID=3708 RepID=A0A078FV44_BRANA|nr:BnaC09g30750D [Brassica napus]
MDSRNPYSQSSSYMGLLNSQNFPYESFPQFSSQQTDAGTQSEDTPVDRKSVAEYSTIWEMKKEDIMMKEKLSKLAILDTLLAKKDPLTEAEEVVKNKLLAEYF